MVNRLIRYLIICNEASFKAEYTLYQHDFILTYVRKTQCVVNPRL